MEVWKNNYSRRWKNISPIKENDLCSLAFDFDIILTYKNICVILTSIVEWRIFLVDAVFTRIKMYIGL